MEKLGLLVCAKECGSLIGNFKNVFQFLTDLHASGKSNNTVNVHCSMLSKTLDAVDGVAIGEDPLIVRLMRGCYHQNPPQPRYNEMWDSGKVSTFFESLGENRNLSLKVLTSKLVTLIALTTWMRVAEVTAISFRSIQFTQEGVKFSLDRLRKTQRCGPLKSFEMTSTEEKLCPVKALKDFIERTEKFRPASEPSEGSRLLIALVRPHKPVSSNTVSRWIKSMLSKGGVDTTKFGAHSTRSAAASRAVVEGAPIDAILQTGSSAHEATFNRFYNRPPARIVERQE